ncbi:hypothetical protein QFZ82_004503 [Streptomyces sp. V4I23]|uniref:hypothetical protein n=1 Tax=Streptomyces sp. V4I23 TaxID=3042282 RepID=UPI002787707E|nr:hypothetical protein [Streptomyces sp. V4I23]MDQ1010018.1 hypothetical protein [Streptomyces sp. V4I23]
MECVRDAELPGLLLRTERDALTRARKTVPLLALLDGRDEPLVLGADSPQPARYTGDAATLIRLYAGRPLTGTRYGLTGATERELLIFD